MCDLTTLSPLNFEDNSAKNGLIKDLGLELSDHANVDCRISFLSPHLKSHGFLFKIPIQIPSQIFSCVCMTCPESVHFQL